MVESPLFPELVASPVPVTHSTGILPYQNITDLLHGGSVLAEQEITGDQVQPASLDLRLSGQAYRIQASFLPKKDRTVMSKLEEMVNRGEAVEIDLSKSAILERGCVYLARLMERLRLPAEIRGRANPKSTTGRLDVLCRLIADFSPEFDKVQSGYKGPLYAEIFPGTFSIVVRAGTRLNQLRLIRGTPPPSDAELNELHQTHALVYVEDEPGLPIISKGLWLSVDLEGSDPEKPVAYQALAEPPVIDFDRRHYYPYHVGWNELPRTERRCLLLEPDRFYILASKERIRIPPTHAAELTAYDPSFGEFRSHYAGFFDPGFGGDNEENPGARAVLEVRSHNVPFLLEDGQVIGRLIFERLLCAPTRLYGADSSSSYQNQSLRLGKQFQPR